MAIPVNSSLYMAPVPQRLTPVTATVIPPMTNISLARHSFSLQLSSAVEKTWDVIKGIATFIFLELIPGMFYHLPRAIFYHLPRVISRLDTDLEAVEKVVTSSKMRQVAINSLDTLQQVVAPENAATRANLGVALDRAARYVAEGRIDADAESARDALEAAGGLVAGVNEAVSEWTEGKRSGLSMFARVTRRPPTPQRRPGSPIAIGGAAAAAAAAATVTPAEEEVQVNVIVGFFQAMMQAMRPAGSGVAPSLPVPATAVTTAASGASAAAASDTPEVRRSPSKNLFGWARSSSSRQAEMSLPQAAGAAAPTGSPPTPIVAAGARPA